MFLLQSFSRPVQPRLDKEIEILRMEATVRLKLPLSTAICEMASSPWLADALLRASATGPGPAAG
jgi:hypothetical protein